MPTKDNELLLNTQGNLNYPPTFASMAEERLYRKQRLAAGLRLFGRFGFDEGVAGHITVRDPEQTDHFWVNPMGKSFKQMKVSDLIRVNHQGQVMEGQGLLNGAAFTIHGHIHQARPEVVAAAHAHSVYGKAWSALGRRLDPITQDACAFYRDLGLFDRYTGVVLSDTEAGGIVTALGKQKACILQNHGLLTVGETVEAALWWYITLERSCQAQLLAEAAGSPVSIEPKYAERTGEMVGSPLAGWLSFQPLYDVITAEQPELLD
jgi:ribulose-5-phosphate 4-epimerase/fuculose-1-phosphate aldolase